MIPHLLHWVWPHAAETQEVDEAALRSWREHHPAWRCLLWTPQPRAAPLSLHDFDLEIRELPPLANPHLGLRLGSCAGEEDESIQRFLAAAASIEIMARYGGVCPPLGEFCRANLEPMLDNVRLFRRDTAIGDGFGPSPSEVELPLYGATLNHPALWSAVGDLDIPSNCHSLEPVSPLWLAQVLQFHLECHPDLVSFPAAAFQTQLSSAL